MTPHLPKGWTKTRIENVCSQGQYGWTTKAAQTGDIKFLRTTDITKRAIDWSAVPFCQEPPDDANKYRIQAGDILISRAGSVGFSALIDRTPYPSVFASYLIRFKVRPGIDGRYLSRFLQSPSYWKQISGMSSGIALANVNAKKLATIELPLAPSNEQRRIADKLDVLLTRMDDCRKRLDRVPDLINRFRQSILAAAAAGRLTQDWRERNACEKHSLIEDIAREKIEWARKNPNHNEAARVLKRAENIQLNTTPTAGELPEGWCWARIEDAMLMVVDCHNKTAPYVSTGIPLIRTSNIRYGEINWEEMRFVSEETFTYWSRRCPPEPGDILFTREAPVAEAAVIPDGMHPCLGQRTMLFRPIKNRCATKYLLFAILDPGFKERALQAAVGTGVKHLRVGDVSELLIPVPPTEEQFEIARRTSELLAMADELEDSLMLATDNVERLTPAIIAKAFRGELVPQDPLDEPASILLERIAGEPDDPRRDGQRKIPKTKQRKKGGVPMVRKLVEVLGEADDWLVAQEAFRRCGIADGAQTEQIEALYSELRELDKAGRLAVEPVLDSQYRKLHDRLKLLV